MSVESVAEKMNIPFFSIIVPVYNVELTYFSACMESILHQSYGDFELILVDDGSKMECANACDQYAKSDTRIRVIHQKNEGVSAARNHGIEVATANWIMFVDADDWLERDACELLKKHLDCVSCDILLFNTVKEFVGKQERLNYGFDNETLYKTDDVNVREMLYSRAMGSPNTKSEKLCVVYYSFDKVYRLDFLKANKIQYPVGIPKSEDKIFILSCFEKMKSLYYVNIPLYHYRINAVSVCNRYSEKTDSDRIMLTKRLEEIAKRMDQEIGEIKKESTYEGIRKQFNRFTFGIISDVLKLKYYHSDYPRTRKERDCEVRAFLNTEPFKSSIHKVRYAELPLNAKLKKFMLSHGMVSQFYRLKATRTNLSKKTAE